MTDPILPESLRSQPVGPRDASSSTPAQRAEDAPSFRALLERLQLQAQDLKASSQSVDGPDQLAGAVDEARASLEDALSLGDRLLEAFRATRVQEGGGVDADAQGGQS